jgi:hypothetical protein
MAAESPFHPRYCGIYDARPLEPGNVAELNQIIRETPWDDERIEKVFSKLYDDLEGRIDDYHELRSEKARLDGSSRISPRQRRRLDDIRDDLDVHKEWFKSFDRRAYLCHVQMAAAISSAWRDELVERYQFGLAIQKFYVQSQDAEEKAEAFLHEMEEDDDSRLMDEFTPVARKAWKTLKGIVQEAQEINLPAMHNFAEGERLADYLLDGQAMAPEPPLESVKMSWAERLVDQLEGVRQRCFDLHSKSVGGILALQEKIAAAWQQSRQPVEDAFLGEPIDAIPAELVDPESASIEEIFEAEVLDEPPPAPPEPPPIVEPSVPAPVLASPTDEFTLDLDAARLPSAPALLPTPMHSETILKPARNGRPPLKITYVRSGEKSPLAG